MVFSISRYSSTLIEYIDFVSFTSIWVIRLGRFRWGSEGGYRLNEIKGVVRNRSRLRCQTATDLTILGSSIADWIGSDFFIPGEVLTDLDGGNIPTWNVHQEVMLAIRWVKAEGIFDQV